jgi:DNA-binding transcriptional LysR family regulator
MRYRAQERETNAGYGGRMDLKDLDLNLFHVFDAVLREKSVTRAGERVGLSQPAMSNALARLRKLFGDPLFLRTPGGMNPTPYAERLAEPVRRALDLLELTLREQAGFDPAVSTRTFRFHMSDIGEVVFLPPLLERLKRDAPGARVEVAQYPVEGIREALETGKIDAALGFMPELGGGIAQRRLFRDRYVCLVRDDHPLIRRGMSAAQFRAVRHVLIASSGTGHEVVERMLEEQGLRGNIALRVPHFMVVPMILARTDLVCTVPLQLAQAFGASDRFRMLEVPLALPAFDVRLLWHERFEQEPGNRWLRGQLLDLFLESDVGVRARRSSRDRPRRPAVP